MTAGDRVKVFRDPVFNAGAAVSSAAFEGHATAVRPVDPRPELICEYGGHTFQRWWVQWRDGRVVQRVLSI